MIAPIGTYTTPNRFVDMAAVFRMAANAGTIPSSNGKAIVAPSPRKTVRLGMAFLVTIMMLLSSSETVCSSRCRG